MLLCNGYCRLISLGQALIVCSYVLAFGTRLDGTWSRHRVGRAQLDDLCKLVGAESAGPQFWENKLGSRSGFHKMT